MKKPYFIPLNRKTIQLFDEGVPAASPAPEVTPSTPPVTPEPATNPEPPAVAEGVSREDFNVAPFLRKFKQEPNEPPKTASSPEEKPPEGIPEVKTDEKPPEPPPETPPEQKLPESTVIKLPDGREVTPEQIVEWEKGNMMQSDYTVKTQKLAEERRQLQAELDGFKTYAEQANQALALWQAIERDPIGTLVQLQAHYANQGVLEPKDPEVLAREDRLRQLDNEIGTREQQSKQKAEQDAYNWLNNQFDTLSKQHSDFDADKVAQFMLDNNIHDPEKAYKVMTHDDKMSGSQKQINDLQAQMDALKAETETKLKAAKDEAVAEYIKVKMTNNTPPPVGANSGTGSPPVQINRPKTMLDAKRAAIARLAGG